MKDQFSVLKISEIKLKLTGKLEFLYDALTGLFSSVIKELFNSKFNALVF